MKVYRKSILRVFMFWGCIFLYIFPPGYAYMVTKRFSLSVFAYFLLFATIFLAAIAISFNYLIFMDGHFIIRNGFYPFWKRKFYYKDISLIEMRHMPRGGVYLKIFKHNGSVSQIPIELVMKADLYEISELLKVQGIQVEIKSLAIKEIIAKAKKSQE